jgi:acetyl esterase/lipase
MLRESVGKPITWLRARQEWLTLYSPDRWKVIKKSEMLGKVACISMTPKQGGDSGALIIYFHGGGYVVGSAEGYSLCMAKIALASKAKVVGVEYRLAPEHALPAAQQDCLAVTQALIQMNQGKKIILMGDSAGGGLCLATHNGLVALGLHQNISAMVLISPWLAPLDPQALECQHEASDILDSVVLAHWLKQFFRQDKTPRELVDFSDINTSVLPPLYIQAAGKEVFSKQIAVFVERLDRENAEHQYHVFDGQFHVFQTFSPLVREADKALNKIGDYVRSVGAGKV